MNAAGEKPTPWLTVQCTNQATFNRHTITSSSSSPLRGTRRGRRAGLRVFSSVGQSGGLQYPHCPGFESRKTRTRYKRSPDPLSFLTGRPPATRAMVIQGGLHGPRVNRVRLPDGPPVPQTRSCGRGHTLLVRYKRGTTCFSGRAPSCRRIGYGILRCGRRATCSRRFVWG